MGHTILPPNDGRHPLDRLMPSLHSYNYIALGKVTSFILYLPICGCVFTALQFPVKFHVSLSNVQLKSRMDWMMHIGVWVQGEQLLNKLHRGLHMGGTSFYLQMTDEQCIPPLSYNYIALFILHHEKPVSLVHACMHETQWKYDACDAKESLRSSCLSEDLYSKSSISWFFFFA